jgi:hypothetical protein
MGRMNDKDDDGDVGGAGEEIASSMAQYRHACYNRCS